MVTLPVKFCNAKVRYNYLQFHCHDSQSLVYPTTFHFFKSFPQCVTKILLLIERPSNYKFCKSHGNIYLHSKIRLQGLRIVPLAIR